MLDDAPMPSPSSSLMVSRTPSALIALGYKPAEATRLLQGIDDGMTTEQMIRLALQKAVR